MAKEKKKSQSEKVLDRIDRLKLKAEQEKTAKEQVINTDEFLANKREI